MRSTPCSARYVPGRAVGLDRAGRADVVGRHRVAELGQHPRAVDVGRPASARAACRRSTGACGRRSSRRPTRTCRPRASAATASARRRRTRRRSRVVNISCVDRGLDDVAATSAASARCRAGTRRSPSGVVPSGSVVEVQVHRPGQRVGDDQRRRGEVVHLDVGVDPALEVAVAGQHRDDREVVLADRGRDLLGQRAGVADAGGAAVADQVEAELLQVRQQAGLLVVVRDDLASPAPARS